MVRVRLARIGRTSGTYLRSNCASHPNGSLTVTQKQMTLWGRLHFGPTFLMVAALRPSELRSSGISRWTRHGLEIIMFMPLPALCVFENRTFHSILAVCACERFSLTSVGRNDWFTVHEGYLVTHMKFWKDLTFLTLGNCHCDIIKGTSGWHRKL